MYRVLRSLSRHGDLALRPGREAGGEMRRARHVCGLGGRLAQLDFFSSLPSLGFLHNYCVSSTPSSLPHVHFPTLTKRSNSWKRNFLYEQYTCMLCILTSMQYHYVLHLNILYKDECFCSKLGREVEHAKSNLKTSLSQIWVICHLLPFVRVGQYRHSPLVSCTVTFITQLYNVQSILVVFRPKFFHSLSLPFFTHH